MAKADQGKTNEGEAGSHRQQELYLTEVLQLMVAREYMRRYRTLLARRVTGFGALRALASSGAIGAWAVWQSYPLVWAGIIAASQVADAPKNVFPFTARHKATNDLVMNLEALLIEALFEAEAVYRGKLTDEEVTERRRKLMRLRHDAEAEHFPTGYLPEHRDRLELADAAAADHFDSIFGPRSTQ